MNRILRDSVVQGSFASPFQRAGWYAVVRPSGHVSCFVGELNQPNPEFCTMIKLDAGNVLLKPSHRRQMMSWLRRALRLGSQLGQFALTITMHRSGKQCE